MIQTAIPTGRRRWGAASRQLDSFKVTSAPKCDALTESTLAPHVTLVWSMEAILELITLQRCDLTAHEIGQRMDRTPRAVVAKLGNLGMVAKYIPPEDRDPNETLCPRRPWPKGLVFEDITKEEAKKVRDGT